MRCSAQAHSFAAVQPPAYASPRTRPSLKKASAQTSMGGRAKLKDAATLAQLVEMLKPYEGGRAPKGLQAFRGVEAAMALNHLHRLRQDPHKAKILKSTMYRSVLK
jgi:hypothetical protein